MPTTVGDIFGAPLGNRRCDGLLPRIHLCRSVLRLGLSGKVQHMCVTWLVALGSNLSALWILVANGWYAKPNRPISTLKLCVWRW
ncbi:cytochrome ubiquinol oxidase subunit I [Escherichia coli]